MFLVLVLDLYLYGIKYMCIYVREQEQTWTIKSSILNVCDFLNLLLLLSVLFGFRLRSDERAYWGHEGYTKAEFPRTTYTIDYFMDLIGSMS